MTLETRSAAKRLLLAVAALGLAACGNDAQIQQTGSSGQSSDQEKQDPDEGEFRDEKQMPPKGYYDALFEEQLKLLDQGAPAASGPQVLWINFDGAAVTKGFGRGQSFILCRANANVPPAGLSPADQEAVLDGVKQYFDDAGAKLVITSDQPASGDFTTMHVGGTFADLGCIGPGVLGVAPFDVGNANRNDVGFAFTKNSSAAVIAETIAHEAGHSFGLDHVSNVKDLMFASTSPQITGFAVSTISGSNRLQDGPAILKQVLGAGGATTTPPAAKPAPATPVPGIPNLPGNLAGLPGLGQIGNIGQLLPGLTPGSILDISQLLPQIQSLLPIASSGVALPGLDKILTIVGVAGASQGGQTAPAGTTPGAGALGGLVDPALANAVLGNTAGLGTIGALATIAGYGDIVQYVQVAQTVLNAGQAAAGGANATTPTPAASVPMLTSVPDLATLLGLAGQNPDIATLLQSLAGTSQVINGNFTGANKDALLSLVKLAYTQQYIDLLQGVTP